MAQVRVLATGGDSKIAEPECAAVHPGEFAQLWQRHGGQAIAVPKVQDDKSSIVGVFLGPGVGDRIEVADVLRANNGMFSHLRIRVQGDTKSSGRYAFFAVPSSYASPFIVEMDVGQPGTPAWHQQLTSVLPCPTAPRMLVIQRMGGLLSWSERVEVYRDAIAFRDCWRSRSRFPIPDVDFARDVVVAQPSLGGQVDALLASDHLVIRDARAFHADGTPWSGVTGCEFLLLPRDRFPLVIEARFADSQQTDLQAVPWSVVQRIELGSPAAEHTLAVLHVRELALVGGAARRCERATTPDEWRELRKTLALTESGLPDDYCDFASQVVVAIAPGPGVILRDCGLAAIEADGTDVLTVSSDRRRPGDHSDWPACLVLKVSRRPAPLSIVLEGTLLRTFAALH